MSGGGGEGGGGRYNVHSTVCLCCPEMWRVGLLFYGSKVRCTFCCLVLTQPSTSTLNVLQSFRPVGRRRSDHRLAGLLIYPSIGGCMGAPQTYVSLCNIRYHSTLKAFNYHLEHVFRMLICFHSFVVNDDYRGEDDVFESW